MFDGRLNKFCVDNNKIVREKGFWQSKHTADAIANFVLDCNFLPCTADEAKQNVQDVKDAFITQKIALIMSECGEALEAMRKQNYGLEKKDTFEDEIADVFIRLCDLCGELNIDIEKQIEWKVSHNKTRDNKHGKSF